MEIAPKVRNASLHLGTAVATAVATATWMSTHSVDLYAIVDQVNDVVVAVTKLLATVSMFVGGAIAFWKGSPWSIAQDARAVAEPNSPDNPIKGVVSNDNPQGRELAAQPGSVEVAGSLRAEAMAR